MDPTTGSYTYFDTEQEAKTEFFIRLVALAYPLFHNISHSIVNIDDAGNESWTTPEGNFLESPMDKLAELEEAMLVAKELLNES